MDAGRPKTYADSMVLERLRLWIVGIIVLGLIGTMTELLLLEHDEQALQFVPLVLMVLGAVTLVWHAMAKSTASLRALQIVMGLFVLWSISSSSIRTSAWRSSSTRSSMPRRRPCSRPA
jgi:predicted membrane protein